MIIREYDETVERIEDFDKAFDENIRLLGDFLKLPKGFVARKIFEAQEIRYHIWKGMVPFDVSQYIKLYLYERAFTNMDMRRENFYYWVGVQ